MTLYLSGMGVLAERFGQLGGPQRWTNYLIVGGRLVGIHVENADETTLTRYFHTDHLGSIAVISNEAGQVAQRLSYDAWGLRRHPDGTPDPPGAIQSESTRGFTGHEHLAEVGLIHMNGRVYDPLLARFGTPDPMTEDPYSTQGWNRYSYVGNSPVNFTDPSGYCFMGCFWKPAFAAIGRFFSQNWRAILQITVTGACMLATQGAGGPACAALGSFVSGITSGNLGQAVRGALIAAVTAAAFQVVGMETAGNLAAKVVGHAAVGCASALAQGGSCTAGATAAAVSAAGTPFVNAAFPDPWGNPGDFVGGTTASALLGGLGSAAGGGNFANGAVTASYGYLFNNLSGTLLRRLAAMLGRETAEALIEQARDEAVRKAWKLEQELVKRGGGSRHWTDAEKAELLKDGRVTGYQGHHRNSVAYNTLNDGGPSRGAFCTIHRKMG